MDTLTFISLIFTVLVIGFIALIVILIKNDYPRLVSENDDLKRINEEHKKLNAKLRKELKEIKRKGDK